MEETTFGNLGLIGFEFDEKVDCREGGFELWGMCSRNPIEREREREVGW